MTVLTCFFYDVMVHLQQFIVSITQISACNIDKLPSVGSIPVVINTFPRKLMMMTNDEEDDDDDENDDGDDDGTSMQILFQ